MTREVCEHFNPVDMPCAKCEEKRKSEALFLADELEIPLGTVIQSEVNRRAAAELRRLYATLERERMRLVACGVVALADTPDSAKHARQMHPDYESASCQDVARRVDECISLRAQRDALLEALKRLTTATDFSSYGAALHDARAAIAKTEGQQ